MDSLSKCHQGQSSDIAKYLLANLQGDFGMQCLSLAHAGLNKSIILIQARDIAGKNSFPMHFL